MKPIDVMTMMILALGSSPLGAAAMDIMGLSWDELTVSVGDRLIDADHQNFVDECYPEFRDNPYNERSNHRLIDQPSGLCSTHFFCGFQQCIPVPEFHSSEMTFSEFQTTTAGFNYYVVGGMSPEDYDEIMQTSTVESFLEWLDPVNNNPAYNLPPKVLFPETAGDVVAAVEFCKKHGVEISIKNSGHSYTGASNKGNTLLLNMNRYKRYSYDNTDTKGIIECNSIDVDAAASDGTNIDLDAELCRLVRARGKPAAIRVGGGENFDKLYRSVKEINERGESYKYHIAGGAAGTVSPMGWTFLGGLAGTTNGRTFGFGVDQVLQIEAVLPNGEHVRFGPTRWEDAPGYAQPKTITVSGVCNQNPSDDEDKWLWKACPEETDALFDDLWFAFRGGGGGTWGIVLSVYLQLHDYSPLTLIQNSCTDPELAKLVARFVVDYYMDPEALDITNAQSNECSIPVWYSMGFMCYSNDPSKGDNLISLYKEFVSNNSEELTEEQIDIAPGCLQAIYVNDWADVFLIREGPLKGKIDDAPNPNYVSDMTDVSNILLPTSWILDTKINSENKTNKEVLIEWYASGGATYWAFGGNAGFAHDQTASLSIGHREAGVMVMARGETVWSRLLPEIYDFTTGIIPPYIGANHLGPILYGPLKEDPTQPCPVSDLTLVEAESMCHSAQEAVWGTETLERLESIKKVVDPNGMLDCFRCVGNNSVAKDPIEKSEKKTKTTKSSKTSKIGKKSKSQAPK